MGAAQSAQREGKEDAADDGNTEETVTNNEEISAVKDSSKEVVDGHCKDEVSVGALTPPDQDVSEPEKPIEEENAPLENVEIIEKEEESLKITEMNGKQNEMSKGFRRIFSNIGLKWTVKRGSSETSPDGSDESKEEEPSIVDVEETVKESKSEVVEQSTDPNVAQETYDNDSTTCPTLTDVTSEDVLENPENKTSGIKEEEATTPEGEDSHQDATSKEEPDSTSPSSPKEEENVSPIKKFSLSAFFSGLWKKKKPEEDEKEEEERIDLEEKEVTETKEQKVLNQQEDEEVCPAVVETNDEENECRDEMLSTESPQMTDEERSSSRNLSTNSTETECPLKWLLTGSLKKKKQSRRSSDSKLHDTTEKLSDQLLFTAENQKDPEPPMAEEDGEDKGAWASFKRRMTPKKRMKISSVSNEEIQSLGVSEAEPKMSEGEQISNHSEENGRRRKDSIVSWDAVLCGSGRKRSRQTSDSEEEKPHIDINSHKQDEHEAAATPNNLNATSFPKQAASPSDIDGGSTWRSLKKLLTPKRKVKDEDVSKNDIQSADKGTQTSYDDDAASGDEDSETPAVVPLSEFNIVETEVQAQKQEHVESHMPEESNNELKQDQMPKAVLPLDDLKTKAIKVNNNDASEKYAITATSKEPDDVAESVSEYQQLSDITEEGIITETMATPAEDAARDDTIAEDLIEMTSEAVTALEPPADVTRTDETEMVSAVSQLSLESSKTSGNTTPVPAEYDVMETDVILYQVVKTISTSPKEAPLRSDELNTERSVGSVSCHVLEKFVQKEPTVLEIHRNSDANTIKTGLTVEELDAIDELAATSLTESISEVKEVISTELVSEVVSDEFDTAENTVDEIQEINIINTEGRERDLDRIAENHPLVKGLPKPGTILHQTVETIPISQKEVPVCSDELISERIVGSVTQQVCNFFKKEEPKVLEMHKRSDATTIRTGLAVQELDVIHDLTASSLTESICEVKEIVPTEVASEVCIGEFDTAETAVDEIKQVIFTNKEESDRDLDRIVETHHLVQGLQKTDMILHQVVDTIPMSQKEVPVCSDELRFERIVGSSTQQVLETFVKEQPEVLEMHKQLDATAITIGLAVEELDVTEELATSSITERTPEVKDIVSKNVESEVSPVQFDTAETAVDKMEEVIVTNTEISEKDLERIVDIHDLGKDLPKSDMILHQVVDDIPIKQKEVPVCSDELRSERIVGSFTQPVLETFVKKETAVLEMHKGLDELDTINELVVATQTESTSEVKDIVSTKVELEVASFETDATDMTKTAADEIEEFRITNEGGEKDFETIADTHNQSEANSAVSGDGFPECDHIVLDVASLGEERHVETESPNIGSQEIDSNAAIIADKTNDGAIEPEVQTVTDNTGQTTDSITHQFQGGDQDLLPVEVEVLQQLVKEQAASLDSEPSVQYYEKDVISKELSATETFERKGETVSIAEAHVDEKQEDSTKTGHDPVAEAAEPARDFTLDSGEIGVHSPEGEAELVDFLSTETVRDEPKMTTENLISLELENKDQSINAVRTENVQELATLGSESVPHVTLDSEKGCVIQSREKEETTKKVFEVQPTTDEPKEDTIIPTEVNLDLMVECEAGHIQKKALEVIHATTSEFEESSCQSLEKEVISEDILETETITDEPKEETVHLPEDNLETAVDREHGHVQESEVQEAAQAPTLDSIESSVQSTEKEAIPEDIPRAETIKNEPKEETVHLPEDNLETAVDCEHGHVQESEVREDAQAPTLDSIESSVQSTEKEVIPEDIRRAETIKNEPKEETVHLTEVNIDAGVDHEHGHVQESEVQEDTQAPTLDSEESSVQSTKKEVIPGDIPMAETIAEEYKDETLLTALVNIPSLGTSQPEHLQETEVIEAFQAAILESKKGSVQSLEEDAKELKIPEVQTTTEEHEKESVLPIEVNHEPVMDSQPGRVQESEALEDSQVPTSDSVEDSGEPLETDTTLENVPEAKTVADEPKKETVPKKVNLDSDDASKSRLAPEALQIAQPVPLKLVKCSPPEPAKNISEGIPETVVLATKVRLEPVDNFAPVDVLRSEHVAQVVQEATSASVEGSIKRLVQEIRAENILKAERTIAEPKDETVSSHLESIVDSEPGHVKKSVVLELVQVPAADCTDKSHKSLGKEVISEETITDQLKEEIGHLIEVNLEAAVDAQHEHVKDLEVQEAAQAPTLDLVESSVQPTKQEEILEDIPGAETIPEEYRDETLLNALVSIPSRGASQSEHLQEPKAIEAAEAAILESKKGIIKSLVKDATLENLPEERTAADESKKETIPTTVNLDSADASKPRVAPETLQTAQPVPLEVVECITPELAKTISEDTPETVVLTTEVRLETVAGQVPTSDSVEGSVKSLEIDATLENLPKEKTAADEPKKETIPKKANLDSDDASKPCLAPEALQIAQPVPLELVKCSTPELAKTISEDTPETVVLTTEVRLETVAGQVPTSDSVEGSVKSLEIDATLENLPKEKTAADEPKKETIPKKVNLDSNDASKPCLAPEALQIAQPVPLELVKCSTPELAKNISEVIPETVVLTTTVRLEPVDNFVPVDVPKSAQVVHAATSASMESNVQQLGQDIITEDFLKAERASSEPNEETVPSNLESMMDSEHGHVKKSVVLEVVHVPAADSVDESHKSLEKEVISENVPKVETITDEPNEETVHLTEVNLEGAVDPGHVQVSGVQEAAQAPTLDSVEGSDGSLEIDTTLENVPEEKTAAVEPEKETISKKVNLDSNDASKPRLAPEALQIIQPVPLQLVECSTPDLAKNTTEDIPETVFLATEVRLDPLEDSKPRLVLHAPILASQKGSSESLLKEEAENLSKRVTITGELKNEIVLPSEVSREPMVESDPGHFEEPGVLQVVRAATLESEEGNAEEFEKEPMSGDVHQDDPNLEVQRSSVQVNDEQEEKSEFPDIEIKIAAVERVVVCSLKDECNLQDVSVTLPNVLIEKTSPISEAVINTAVTAEVFKGEVKATKPLVKRSLAKSAEESSKVVKMPMQSATFKDDHSIQLEAINVDVKSAEIVVDSGTEVGQTDVKDMIDVCHETVEKVENLSTNPEEELIKKENKATIQEVFQHVTAKLQGAVPVLASASLEQEVTERADDISRAENEITDVEDQHALMKPTDPSQAEVEEVKEEEFTKSTPESQNQTEFPGVTAQTTQITEPEAVKPERTPILTQMVELEVDIQPMEKVEPIEQIPTVDRATCRVQAAERVQPVRPTQKTEAIQSRPVLSEAEKQMAEKSDQEVWIDANEIFCTPEKTEVFHEVEEYVEPQTVGEQDVKEGLGYEGEATSGTQALEDEHKQAIQITREQHESEEEDFAIALDDPEIVTATVTIETA